MRLKNEQFFVWLNNLIFRLFYLRHQGKSAVVIDAEDDARFWVRVNTSDILMIWEIWKAKVYDDARIPIDEGDIVLDLGAHIGSFAVRAARLAHHGHVYAYEASSKNYVWLEKNRQLNGLGNLYVENSAISEMRGTMPLYTPAGNSIMGSLLQEISSFIEMVQVKTFADIIAEHSIGRIDFLKMDVEGAEYDILLNCSDETLAKIRRIVMEYHEFDGDKRKHQDLVNLLNSHGFNVVVQRNIFPPLDWFGAKIIKTGIIKAWRD